MDLKLPAHVAIKQLQKRIDAVHSYGFNSKAWKDRTLLEISEIFPATSPHWLQVNAINFDTFIVADKAKILEEGKDTAKKLLSSYIEWISEHSKIAADKMANQEVGFEEKYYALITELNSLANVHKSLKGQNDSNLEALAELGRKLRLKEQEMSRIKDETIQLENVSFKKLWHAFFGLPIGVVVTIVTSSLGLLVAFFGLGSYYERNAANNELFDLRNMNIQLQEQNKKIELSLDSTKQAISDARNRTLFYISVDSASLYNDSVKMR